MKICIVTALQAANQCLQINNIKALVTKAESHQKKLKKYFFKKDYTVARR
jgi:hypothetical protein